MSCVRTPQRNRPLTLPRCAILSAGKHGRHWAVKRRDFITLLGGGVVWPLGARAQQRERLRRIGVLMNRAAENPEGQDRLAAFHQGLQELGWGVGRNVLIDTRWSEDNADRTAKHAARPEGSGSARIRAMAGP